MRSIVLSTLLVAATTAALFSTTADAAEYLYNNGRRAVSRVTETGKGWPPCSPDTEQWSGLLEINSTTNKHYFYWGFGPRSRRADAPVILWMTGGPGCSSSLAVLVENGPCHISLTDSSMYRNPYAWNEDANVIFIDQPAGVGFSTADKDGYDHNEAEVSEDMYWFLQELYKLHPQWYNNEFFVVGESYGGHFAPATAHRVYLGNKRGDGKKLPLAGLAVGNGLTAPYVQYKYYEELAYNWCQEKLGTPCITKEAAQQMNASIPQCIHLIEQCMSSKSMATCSSTSNICNGGQMGPYESTGRNVYDIRKKCDGNLCYNFTAPTAFMNREDVQASMGISPSRPWKSCAMNVNSAFTVDWFQTFDADVVQMLEDKEANIRVMIYAGDVDFICNWIGNKAWTLHMDWSMKHEFNKAADVPYYTEGGKEVGKTRHVSSHTSPIKMSFVQVYNAGHMVPMDQPEAILSIMTKFLKNKPFN